jgi:1-acyl-sn-glycerol-3-phosphate acyltransferase
MTEIIRTPEIPAATTFQRWRSWLLQAPLMILSTAICGAIAYLCSFWDRSGRQQHSIARIWAASLTWLSLSRVTVLHPERLRSGHPAVYVCNHLSYMDTPVLFSRLPFQFRILARHDLWNIPLLGGYLKRSGQIPVNFSDQRSTVASLNRGVASLKDGMPLVIFPDGGRSEDGHIHPFKKGAAFMAIRAQVPIIPMALIGTYEVMPMHVYHLHPRPLLLAVGEPISTLGCTSRDADAITTRLYDAIFALYYQHSTLIAPTGPLPSSAG